MSRLRFAVPLIAVLFCACRSNEETLTTHLKRGDDFLAQQKLDEAILEYRNAVKVAPSSGEARAKLGDAYLQRNDVRGAFSEIIRAADLMPQNVEAQIKAGQALLLAGQFEDASGRADKVLALDPKSIPAQILKGNALAGLKDIDGAIAQVESAIQTDPTQSTSYQSLGALLQFAKGDTARAEESFKKAVAMDPKSVNARLALANLYWAMGRRPEAEKAFADTLAIEPRNLLSNRAMALFFLGSGRTAEAETPLKILAEDMPGPGGRIALADFYVSAKRLPEAKLLLEKATSDPQGSATARLRLAAVALTEGDRPTARKLIDAILEKQPKHTEALIGKALIQFDDGQSADALATSRLAVASNLEAPQAHAVLGRVLAADRQLDEAMMSYREALRLNPRFAQAGLELARLSLQTSKYADAIQFAQGAINAVPGYAEAHLLLARALLASGRTADAEKPIKLLAGSFGQLPVVQAEVGRLLLAKGDVAGARASFERALAKDPLQIAALDGVTLLDLQQKKGSAAKARLDAATKSSSPNATLHVVAARHYVALGDTASAEQSLQQALTIDPRNFAAYEGLARLYVKQNRLNEAINQFEKLAKMHPRSVGPPTAVGVLLQIQNRLDEASARYQKVLELDPRSPVAANNLAQLYADRNQNLDLALQLAQTAKAGLPDLSEVDDTLGWVYYKKNLLPLSISSLKRSVAAQPNNPLYLFHLGMAYASNGDNTLARDHLEKALKIHGNFDGADEARKTLGSLKG